VIRPVTYYVAVCDRCGKAYEGYDYSAWSDEDSAELEATESGWEKLDDGPDAGKLLCDECWAWDDEEDCKIAKPAEVPA
jgi:hypothetical protein